MPSPTVIALTSDKGGVGKSTLAVNLAGALSLNATTVLVDEDPIQSCYTWAQRANALPMSVMTPDNLNQAQFDSARYVVIDTEGRPKFADVLELVTASHLVVIPCGTSGLEIDATVSLSNRLRDAKADMSKVKVAITKAPPVGSVGQQARDALAELDVPVAKAVVRSYAAHQRAAEQGVLVRDVSDPRSAQAWGDILELAMEVVGR